MRLRPFSAQNMIYNVLYSYSDVSSIKRQRKSLSTFMSAYGLAGQFAGLDSLSARTALCAEKRIGLFCAVRQGCRTTDFPRRDQAGTPARWYGSGMT